MSFIPDGNNLFVVSLEYLVPFEQVEPHLDAHMGWIKERLSANMILVAGAKVPRTGGVIIATAESAEALQAALERDPFHSEGIASFTVTEFRPNTRADLLK